MSSAFVSSLVKDFGSEYGKQYGENGAVEFTKHGVRGESSRKVEGYLTAAFARISRGVSRNDLESYVKNVFDSDDCTRDDLEDFVSMVFQSRECRGDGKGERMAFYHLMFILYKYVPNTVLELLKLVPEYGYWKDYQNMIEMSFTENCDSMRECIYNIWVEQLKNDIYTIENDTGGELSLASKYFPKEGRSLDRKYKICESIARMYFNDYRVLKDTILKRFRKEVLSPLTKKIGIIERMMSTNEWDKIVFKLVPGRCLNINRKAFLNIKKDNSSRHPYDEIRNKCRDNLTNHLEMVKTGNSKINGKQMFLHELIGKFINNWSYNSNISEDEKSLIEAQWEDHYKHYEQMVKEGSGLDKVMVLADFSGSMAGEPMKVAGALAIMISSLLPKPWKNKFISFDSNPSLIEIPDVRLSEKVEYCMNSPWGGHTDFLAAIHLILKVGIDNKLSADEMPEKLVVVSDMQFDSSTKSDIFNSRYYLFNEYGNNGFNKVKPDIKDKTTHDIISESFKQAGIKACGKPWEAPTIVYWNVRCGNGFPVQSDTPNTQLLSGFSLSLLKLVLDNGAIDNMKQPTPYETFLNAVRSEKYSAVRDIINSLNEKPYFKSVEDDWEQVN